MGQFGDKFRKAREGRSLSLDDVSNVTKISSRMLQAIEEERFDQLPGGVFNKGFIRAYAKHLGLNSDDAVNDYLLCLRQAQIDSHEGWDSDRRLDPRGVKTAVATEPETRVKAQVEVSQEELPDLQLPRAEDIRTARKEYLGRPAPQTPWTTIAIIAGIILVAVLLWFRHSPNPRTLAAKPSTQPAATLPAPVATAISRATAPAIPAQSHPVTPSTVSTSSTAPALHPGNASTQSTPATNPTTKTTPPAITPDLNQVKIEKKGDVTIRSFGNPTDRPTEKPAASLTLVIRASENSWISVTSDGQLLTQETLIAPAATSFHATRELVVRVGNAAGVRFLWNGQELSTQGAEAEAKTFIFDAQGMRAPASDPAQQ